MQKATIQWLRKFIGKEDRYFDLFEAGAEEARTSVALLSDYLQKIAQGAPRPELADFAETRRRQKRIRDDMVEALSKSIVTPMDREDIQALLFALYRIPKAVEKMAERLSIYPGRVPYAAFQRQAELLTIAADAVVVLVGQLRAGPDIEKVREANARLQRAEGEADKLMLQWLEDLYRGPYDPKEVVILQNLYELVERAVDRCRNVGNIIVRIALKNA